MRRVYAGPPTGDTIAPMWSNFALFAMGLLAVAFGIWGITELAAGETTRVAILASVVGIGGLLALIAVAYSVIATLRERRAAREQGG